MTYMPCDRCTRNDALAMSHRLGNTEYLCPTCAAHVAAEDAAHAHLHALLLPALSTWARHWHGAGLRPEVLGSILDVEGLYWHPDGALGRKTEGARALIDEVL